MRRSGAAFPSPQAVRGAGPHEGVRLGGCSRRRKHGYERERSDRIEPCDSFLARETA